METGLGGGRRRSHRLSAQAVRRATAPGLYADGWGLYLLVGRNGTKSWVYRYRQDALGFRIPGRVPRRPCRTDCLTDQTAPPTYPTLGHTTLRAHLPIRTRKS